MRTSRAVLFALVAALSTSPAAFAQRAVIVVRHAEKISESDERLSEAGRKRAERLAAMLRDAGVGAIYTTDTERATDTAAPLARALGLRPRIYDVASGAAQEDSARRFVAGLAREHPDGVLLVVGHSNTVPGLLKALGCREAITLAADEYDDLFLAVPREKGPATLIRLRY